MNNNAIKIVITLIFTTILVFSSFSRAEQLDDQAGEIIPNEETIGGIGGTGIRSMNRPEILERPERIERPELLESREALDNSFEIDSPADSGADEIERPDPVDK